jgi:hypothetical protein
VGVNCTTPSSLTELPPRIGNGIGAVELAGKSRPPRRRTYGLPWLCQSPCAWGSVLCEAAPLALNSRAPALRLRPLLPTPLSKRTCGALTNAKSARRATSSSPSPLVRQGGGRAPPRTMRAAFRKAREFLLSRAAVA